MFNSLKFKIIILSLGLVFICLSFLPTDNQKTISAQEQSFVCDTKIPIGEAVDRTSDLLNDMYKELETIYRTIPGQIDFAEQMIAGAKDCDLDYCKPVCSDTSCYARKKDIMCPGDFACMAGSCSCSECSCSGDDCNGSSGSCSCNCQDETKGGCCLCSPFCEARCEAQTCKGKICPDLQLPNILVDDAFQDIDNAFKKIKAMYGEDAEESEEIGNDIMLASEDEDDRLTQEEAIQRKLNKARIEFNNCTIPASKEQDVLSGKIVRTRAMICQDVLAQHGALPQGSIEECTEVCKEYNTKNEISIECTQCLCGSLINYFCCH